MICPLCKQKFVGKIGNNQFYCSKCFVEFSIKDRKITIYEVSDDGSLLPYTNSNKSNVSNLNT